jgi:hypothetical protein
MGIDVWNIVWRKDEGEISKLEDLLDENHVLYVCIQQIFQFGDFPNSH